MATIHRLGVRWYDRAFDSAVRRGVEGEVAAIARAYADGSASVVVYPDPSGPGKLRVQRGVFGAVLGFTGPTPEGPGVVIGFIDRSDASSADRRPSPGPRARPTRTGPAKAHTRGPRDYDELRAWLAEAGYTSQLTRGGHWAVVGSDGVRIGTLAATASDHRSLANDVRDLRRSTGLTLRIPR